MPKPLSRVLFLLAIAFCICRAERLSTGEDVKSYVSRMIDENEVGFEFGASTIHRVPSKNALWGIKTRRIFDMSSQHLTSSLLKGRCVFEEQLFTLQIDAITSQDYEGHY